MAIPLYHCPQRFPSYPLVVPTPVSQGKIFACNVSVALFQLRKGKFLVKRQKRIFLNYYFNLLLTWLCRTIDKPNFDLLSWVYAPLPSIAQDQSPVMDPSQERPAHLLEGTWVV